MAEEIKQTKKEKKAEQALVVKEEEKVLAKEIVGSAEKSHAPSKKEQKAEEVLVVKEEEKVLAKEMAEKKEVKHEHKAEGKESKSEDKKEKKPEVKIVKTKKEEAVASGQSLHLSKKHAIYICNFIKDKSIDQSINELQQVIAMKRAIPFKGEIPHRKGMMSGRYPVAASKIFISLLKGLKGNVLDNQMDLDKTKIYYCSANWAFRPARSGGRMAKRSHVTLKAKEFNIVEAKK
jgi:large subunit ribosomal protein L22